MAKRISDLAKELGMTSKTICERLTAEGMQNPRGKWQAANTVTIGQETTIREWFADVSGPPATPGGQGAERAGSVEATNVGRVPALALVPPPIAVPPILPRESVEAEAAAAATGEALVGVGPSDSEALADTESAAAGVAMETPAAGGAVSETPLPVESATAMSEETPSAPAGSGAVGALEDAVPVPAPVMGESAAGLRGRAEASGQSEFSSLRPLELPAEVRRRLDAERQAELARIKHEAEEAQRASIVPAPQNIAPKPTEEMLRQRGRQLEVKQVKLSGPKVIGFSTPDPVSRPRPMRDRGPVGTGGPRTGGGFGGGGGGSAFGGGLSARGPMPLPDAGAVIPGRSDTGRGANRHGGKTKQQEEEERARARSPRRKGNERDESRGRAYSDLDVEERNLAIGQAGSARRRVAKATGPTGQGTLARKDAVEVTEPIILKAFCSSIGVSFNEIARKMLAEMGELVTINHVITAEQAATLAAGFGVKVTIARAKNPLEEVEAEFASRERVHLAPRPPVITILGHVDHGKTSLLDRIRTARVAAGEAGGITQHIGAYHYNLDGVRVTFLDTPGHKAFTEMRSRGAKLTDIVVLVVAADDGVQPQTVECISHAKAAGVPIVIALNKIDKPDANEVRVLGQLAEHGLQTTEWGGEVEVFRTSAITGQGIPELLEHLHLQAQILELQADPELPACGTVLEATMQDSVGRVATMLVQEGTLRVGDVVTAGVGAGRVRSMKDDLGRAVREVGPGLPVRITGWDELPTAGDRFYVMDDIHRAQQVAELFRDRQRQQDMARATRATTLDTLGKQLAGGELRELNIILKTDMQGSLEVLKKEISDLSTSEVSVRILHAAVGGVSESDILLAEASKAIVIGFSVAADSSALNLAEERRVEIRTYRVIYEITDEIRKAMEGMLEPEVKEERLGRATVLQVFRISKVGNIAGCRVTDGLLQRSAKYRLIRNGVVLREGMTLESLKRVKDDAREVKSGLECGIRFSGFDDLKEGDTVEAYQLVESRRTLA